MTTATTPDDLGRALAATGALVKAVDDGAWSRPTGCPPWTVRDLLNHLVGGNYLFAGILRGATMPEQRPATPVDVLGDDPAAAYRASAAALLAAVNEPGALDGTFRVPAGTVPGPVVLNLRLTEILVHGWDLAAATGQPAMLPDDLAEKALSFARGSQAPDVPRTGHPFGLIQAVPDDAPAIDRLAGFLGRPLGAAGQPRS